MTTVSEETKLAVLSTQVIDMREDLREVRAMLSDKIASKEYVDDRINPIKRLVYWMLGLIGAILLALVTMVLGIVIRK